MDFETFELLIRDTHIATTRKQHTVRHEKGSQLRYYYTKGKQGATVSGKHLQWSAAQETANKAAGQVAMKTIWCCVQSVKRQISQALPVMQNAASGKWQQLDVLTVRVSYSGL